VAAARTSSYNGTVDACLHRIATALLLALAGAAACAQTAQTQPAGMQAIDECGTLTQGAGCTLFEGAGGKYVVVASGDFRAGDAVRVVGTVDPQCITICPDADGCIRGAVLYDPAVFPCGTALPNFPEDIITGVCSTLSASLLMLTLAGLIVAGRRVPARRDRPRT